MQLNEHDDIYGISNNIDILNNGNLDLFSITHKKYILHDYYVSVISISKDYKYKTLNIYTAAFLVDKLIYDINAFVEISIDELGKSYWDIFKSETKLYNGIANLIEYSKKVTLYHYGFNEYVYNIIKFQQKYFK